MAKATRLSMIVDRFVSYNYERYRNDPIKSLFFIDLKEEELVFEDMVLAAKGVRSSTIRSPTREFVGYNQRWVAAEINNPHAFELTEEEVIESEVIALNKSEPGVYVYMDGNDTKILILVPRDTPVANRDTVATTMFVNALLFDTLPSDIVVRDNQVVITGPCMWGGVKFAPASDPIMQIGTKQYGQLTHPEDLVI